MAKDLEEPQLNGEAIVNGHIDSGTKTSETNTQAKLTNGTHDTSNGNLEPVKAEVNGESDGKKLDSETKKKSNPVVRYDE